MPSTTPLGRFSYTTTSGAAPRGEFKFTVSGTVTKVARVDHVRQKADGTYFVTGTYWPVCMFGGRVNGLPDATFLY